MLNPVSNKNRILKFVKLFIFTLIFYLIIKYFFPSSSNILDVDENLYQTGMAASGDYDESWKELLGKHDVAPSEQEVAVDSFKDLDGEENEFLMKFQAMCLSNISFCAKIKFQGDFLPKDKYMYLASSIYVLKHMEENLTTGLLLKNQLKKITINNDRGSRRGFANWDSVTINLGAVSSFSEFLELIAHEMGHVADLGIIRGKSKQTHALYTEFDKSVFAIDDPSIDYYKLSWQSEKIRKSSAKKEDFCSSYGMTDPFEDFAECHNLYLNHNALFNLWAENNEIMQKKYNFMSNLYGGKYMFNSPKDLEKSRLNKTWRPWDTTKM